MTRLIVLIGLSGSGKSSLAASMQQTCPDLILISTDAIRAKLFGSEEIQGAWCLVWREVQRQFQQAVNTMNQGQNRAAIYDATNARRRYRREAIALARSTGFTQITGLWLDVPLSVCLQRNQQRDRNVPDNVIHQMHRQLLGAPPSLDEGLEGLIRFTEIGIEETRLIASV